MIKTLLNRFARPVAAVLSALLAPSAALGQGETGPVARFTTSAGTLTFTLFDSKPISTTNFINIIAAGNYNNVILNRNPQDFVIQGGGFFAPSSVNGAPPATPAVAPITGEPGVSNIRGTLAMALSTGPNSGTKEFFFNLTDNSFLDTGNGGPFTVFGRVRGAADQSVLDTINGLTKFNICSQLLPAQNCSGSPANLPFGSVPLIGYAGTPTAVAITNYVTIQVAEVSPQIRTQPVAQAIFANQNANFSVVAAGTGTLTYQWRRNGTNLANGGAISGATSPNLTITGAQLANAGSYDCLVSNNVTTELAIAAAASAAVALTVDAAPTINNHPSPVNVNSGGNAQFAVTASGAGTLTFQWRKGNANLANGATGNGSTISNATTSTLTITGVTPADAGNYNCVVTNTAGSTPSNDAALSVNVAPAATMHPSNATVTQGQATQFTAAFSGTPAPTLQWFKGTPGSGTMVNGATSGTLNLNNVQPGDAGMYYCAATNVVSTVNSNAASLTVNVPAGVSNPANTTVNSGQTAMFAVTGTGSPAPTFQWRKGTTNLANGGTGNGSTIGGATTNTLTITGAVVADAGNYNCVVTNIAGSATSADATLGINVAPAITSQPANTSVVTGGTAHFTVAASGTPTPTFQWRKGTTNLVNGGNISGATSATLNLANAAAGDAGNYNCVVTNSVSSATSNDASLTVTNAPVITTQPATNGIALGGGATLTVAATGSAPLTYQWQRNGTPITNGTTAGGSTVSGATSSSLVLSNFANGDVDPVAFRCVVTNASGNATSNAVTFVVVAAPSITNQPVDRSVTIGSSATFNVVASGGGTLVYKWRKNGIMLTDGGSISGSGTANLTINPVAQADFGAYDVVVSNGAGQASSVVVSLIKITAPSITTHPTSATKDPGQSVTFTVAATGTSPLSYQWRKGMVNLTNGGRFSGATAGSLTITGLVAGDAADYSCVVTNSAGNATSNAATLTINTAPTFTTHPSPLTVNQGANASFTVAASGPGTITYQWRRNGTPLSNGGAISGATSTTLTITGVVGATDTGAYDCLATNSVGTTTSNSAALTVNTPPAITMQPAPQTVVVGGTANFSVTATGAGLTYRWRRNGVNLNNGARISGALTANLSITGLVAGDAGNYSVVVTGSLSPAVTSSNAALTVITLPVITSHPASITLDPQSTANFAVLASGSGLTYQWFKGTSPAGTPLTNGSGISGATAAGLTITNVLNGVNDGTYYCVVTNLAGSATSNAGTLTVRDIPYFTTHPSNVPTGITGQGAAFSVVAMGGAPITYQWYKGTPQSNTPVANSGHISGADSATLSFNPIAGNAAGGSADAGTYFCIATNPNGTRNSNTATLTVFFPPFITNQSPAGGPAYVVTGHDQTFSVTVAGSPTLAYQWYRTNSIPKGGLPGGTPIDGATGSSYTLTNAQSTDNALFYCRITNAYGAVNSETVVLNVGDPPVVTGGNRPETLDVPLNGNDQLSVTNSGTVPISYQWRLNGQNLSDNIPRGNIGTLYSGTTSATLSISGAQYNGNGSYDCVLTNSYGSATSSSTAVTVVGVPEFTVQPMQTCGYFNGTLSFSVAANGGHLAYQWQFSDNNVDFFNLTDSNGGFFNGGDATTIAGSQTPTITFGSITYSVNRYYRCVVTNVVGTTASNGAYGYICGSPYVIVNPQNSPAALGGTATFTAQFYTDGPGPLTYQWYHNDQPVTDTCNPMRTCTGCNIICGATTSTLTISGVSPDDAGDYYCIATDPSNFTGASTEAFLLSPRLPTNEGAYDYGENQPSGNFWFAYFFYHGSGPFTIQWTKDGAPFVPDNSRSYIFQGGAGGRSFYSQIYYQFTFASDTGQYRCVVTNAAGSVEMYNKFITFGDAPLVVAIAGDSTVGTGATLNLNAVLVRGTAPLTYAWYSGDTQLSNSERVSGADTGNLQITGITGDDAGTYTCVVTNAYGTGSSQNTVTVGTPPSIVGQTAGPINQPSGGMFGLTLDTAGDAPFTYEWRRNGMPLADDGRISGSTSDTLNVSMTNPTDSGTYTCVVTNDFGQATTADISVTITGIPARVTGNPVPLLLRTPGIGASATFTVVAEGDPAPTYQWYKDGNALANGPTAFGSSIAGADTATITISDITERDIPTSGPNTITNLPDFPTSGSPYGFFLCDLTDEVPGNDTLYVADDLASGGSIQKYSLVSGAWVADGSVVASAARGLTGYVGGDGVHLFATLNGSGTNVGGGSIVAIIDNSGYHGMFAPPAPTFLASASPDSTFRGIAYVPVQDFAGRSSLPGSTPITGGNLLVYRVGGGDGVGLTNTGSPVYIDEFNQAGNLVQSIDIPDSGPGPKLIASGTATSEGFLTVSPNGLYVAFVGYDAPLGGMVPVGATNAPRSVCIIDVRNGAPNINNSLSDYAVLSSPRSAVTDNGNDIWLTAGNGGIRYTSVGATSSVEVSNTVANIRQINIFGGRLHVSTGSGSAVRIGNLGPLPPLGSDFGNYYCLATNVLSSDTSENGALQKLGTPVITGQPQPLTRDPGQSAAFTVTIDAADLGDNTATYTWTRGGVPIDLMADPRFTVDNISGNVSASTLTITSLTVGDAGAYAVIVHNDAGNTTSNDAALTVTNPCRLDYTPDGSVNSDDLGDFITDYFTVPPVSGPGGYAVNCAENDPPFDAGYKAAFTFDGSPQCFEPNSDNLGDFITSYFDPNNNCGNNGNPT